MRHLITVALVTRRPSRPRTPRRAYKTRRNPELFVQRKSRVVARKTPSENRRGCRRRRRGCSIGCFIESSIACLDGLIKSRKYLASMQLARRTHVPLPARSAFKLASVQLISVINQPDQEISCGASHRDVRSRGACWTPSNER